MEVQYAHRTVALKTSSDRLEPDRGLCELLENCFTCEFDCGFCNQCGDGFCDFQECCQADCGTKLCQ